MRYRIHRMKDTPRENFRWAAHTGGVASVRPKDYDLAEEIDAASAYSAWRLLLSQQRPLRPGDLLETVDGNDIAGRLEIAKYIGFEPAQWFLTEPKSQLPVNSGSDSVGLGPKCEFV